MKRIKEIYKVEINEKWVYIKIDRKLAKKEIDKDVVS